jgi:hypothetical protein
MTLSITKSHSIIPQHSLLIVRPRPQKAVKCLGGPGLGLVGVLWRDIKKGQLSTGREGTTEAKGIPFRERDARPFPCREIEPLRFYSPFKCKNCRRAKPRPPPREGLRNKGEPRACHRRAEKSQCDLPPCGRCIVTLGVTGNW